MRWIVSVLLALPVFGQGPVPSPVLSGGSDGGGGSGVTSITAQCGLSGGTITSTGAIATSVAVTAHNGTYAILTGDCGNSLTSNVAAAWSLAQAGSAGFPAGWTMYASNVGGSGNLVITAATSTFYGNGASGSTETLTPGTAVRLVSDGTNWQVFYTAGPGSGGSSPTGTGAYGGIAGVPNTAAVAGTATGQPFAYSSSAGIEVLPYTLPATVATNDIIYASSATQLNVIAPVNSAVLVTSAGGVPSESTTLPSGLAMNIPASLTLTNATGLPPAGVTSAQGNGTKFQFSTGTTTTNDCVKFDANGNTSDSGAPCPGGSNITISHTFTGNQEIAYVHGLGVIIPSPSCYPTGGNNPGIAYPTGVMTANTTTTTYVTATDATVVCLFVSGSGLQGPIGPAVGPGLTSGALAVGASGGTNVTTPCATCTLSSGGALAVVSVATGTSPPSVTAGTGGVMAFGEGTVPSAGCVSGVDCVYSDPTQHGLLASFNGGSYLPLIQGPATAVAGHVATWLGTNGGKLADGGATTGSGNFVLAGSPTFTGLPVAPSFNVTTAASGYQINGQTALGNGGGNTFLQDDQGAYRITLGDSTQALKAVYNSNDHQFQSYSGASLADIGANGLYIYINQGLIVQLSTPSSSSGSCIAGSMWADATYMYVCTASNTIKRVVLATF